MMRNWNPLEADYLGDHNSYHVDVTDAQVAVQGYKPDHEGQVCKFFARGDKCFRAENCPYEHVAGGEDLAPPDRSEVLCYARDLRCAAPGAWLAADVSAIYNPQHFYVVLPFGSHPVDRLRNDVALQRRLELEENLDSLMTDMNEHYSRAVYRDRPLVSLALGEIVAALHMADETWCRARVVDTNDDDCTVEVLYIDYGNMEWLPERRVRMLLSRFTRLPFQAVECFLEGIEPPGGDGAGWNEDATRVAEDLVDGRTLTAKVVSWEENGMLHAELYYIDSDCPTNIVDIGAALVESGVARYVSSPQSLNNTMH
ncbi:PREDICTED: tudor domain-containing protein 1-like [Priapulus caudatus]|uniref:Tudor domain-containing protein 1-like n=1 Tax=Priapulus caudatus TaxID=37621 RepID=A0ABM1EF89_PRICU|nr:PREDICTED: tudor domain-containing protein 1-like [Priapulus caudatus]